MERKIFLLLSAVLDHFKKIHGMNFQFEICNARERAIYKKSINLSSSIRSDKLITSNSSVGMFQEVKASSGQQPDR